MTTTSASEDARPAEVRGKGRSGNARPRRSASPLRWLGIVPLSAYLAAFLIIPAVELVVAAFETPRGSFTFGNLAAIFRAQYLSSFEVSLELSALAALFGGILGLLAATAIVHPSAPRFVRSAVTTFSGMAANFAGVPLAFAFTSTLGATGVLTVLLHHVGISLAAINPNSTTLGLALVYNYFEFPLMLLLLVPALDGLKREWREAAESLGASGFAYWRTVAFPILLPSLLGAMVLLFGGAFSAYATAYALSGSTGNLVTELIGNLTNGNITVDPQLAYALAFGMMVVMALLMAIYYLLQRRASRWLR